MAALLICLISDYTANKNGVLYPYMMHTNKFSNIWCIDWILALKWAQQNACDVAVVNVESLNHVASFQLEWKAAKDIDMNQYPVDTIGSVVKYVACYYGQKSMLL